MPYSVGGAPSMSTDDGQALAKYIDQELSAIQSSMVSNVVSLPIIPIFAAPSKPRTGMTVYADGTKWNPGSGEGLYAYNSAGNWIFLEDNPSLPSFPLSVANGGTGDSGTAWASYTPTVTSASGTITTVSAVGFWKSIGKTIFLRVAITITTAGTAATAIVIFTLPVAGKTSTTQIIPGRDIQITGKALIGTTQPTPTSMLGTNYDNSGPIATGSVLVFEGCYESA